MVCVYVQEHNPQALMSGLSPFHTHNHYNKEIVLFVMYVQEDNPQALVSGLSPIHTHNHTITKKTTTIFVIVLFVRMYR